MFAKRLIEKASLPKLSLSVNSAAGDSNFGNVQPRLVSHDGIPSGAHMMAYDDFQRILAISTSDGRIKLFGKDNTQLLLESSVAVPSKFLQFVQNKGVLLNLNVHNHLEVWDLERKELGSMTVFQQDVTAFALILQTECIYIGDSSGNISVAKLDLDTLQITIMEYSIPSISSRGTSPESPSSSPVALILPQPAAESQRVLLVFRDGLIVLWGIRENEVISSTGRSFSQWSEAKDVSAGCWVCPIGSKVAVGYSNGEITICNIPVSSNLRPPAGVRKLNLGYRSEKVPITSLRWLYADGKGSRIYVLGASEFSSNHLLQVVLLDDHSDTRTIKVPLHLPEPCSDMEIIEDPSEGSKIKQRLLILVGNSGQVHAYDDLAIERNILQPNNQSASLQPERIKLNMPLVTVSKLISNTPTLLNTGDQEFAPCAKDLHSIFPWNGKAKDGAKYKFSGFTSIRKLFITGHCDGGVRFWDVSFATLFPIITLTHQSEEDSALSGVPVSALHFDCEQLQLITGDHSGMVYMHNANVCQFGDKLIWEFVNGLCQVRIFKLKSDVCHNENRFRSFTGGWPKDTNRCFQSVQCIKVRGVVSSLDTLRNSGYLAIGTEKGNVGVYDVRRQTMLYESRIESEVSASIVSLQFQTCVLDGYERNVLVVATKDSSLLAFDVDNGNSFSTCSVRPKKSSKGIFMQTLEFHDENDQKKTFVLTCSQNSAYVYSLSHCIRGIKKVHCKKKFESGSCFRALTFSSSLEIDRLLLFISGKIEIRSLPDLTLLKESSLRGLISSWSNLDSIEKCCVCCSRDGEIILVNGDHEVLFVSTLVHKEQFRDLDARNQVYRICGNNETESLISLSDSQAIRKKGMLSFLSGGSKSKCNIGEETEDSSKQQMSATSFSDQSKILDVNLAYSRIDDRNISRKKTTNLTAAFEKNKLVGKFHSWKGKIRQIRSKNEPTTGNNPDSAVDHIKKKYGFIETAEMNSFRAAKSKLEENEAKLQAISLKTATMEDSARSFASIANEMLHTVEKEK